MVIQAPLPHVLEWEKVGGTNGFVPQTMYQPYTEADRKRYVRDVELQDTIFFHSDDPSELGINLDDVLKHRLVHLKDRGDRMFFDCGPSVSIRIRVGSTHWTLCDQPHISPVARVCTMVEADSDHGLQDSKGTYYQSQACELYRYLRPTFCRSGSKPLSVSIFR